MNVERWQILYDPVIALDYWPGAGAEFDVRWAAMEDQSKAIGERMCEMRAFKEFGD
jgi:hypothetical protein